MVTRGPELDSDSSCSRSPESPLGLHHDTGSRLCCTGKENLLSSAEFWGSVRESRAKPPSLTQKQVRSMHLPRLKRSCCCQRLALPTLWQDPVTSFPPSSAVGFQAGLSWLQTGQKLVLQRASGAGSYFNSMYQLLSHYLRLGSSLLPSTLSGWGCSRCWSSLWVWERGMYREGFARVLLALLHLGPLRCLENMSSTWMSTSACTSLLLVTEMQFLLQFTSSSWLHGLFFLYSGVSEGFRDAQ